jgi:hypothetical protein
MSLSAADHRQLGQELRAIERRLRALGEQLRAVRSPAVNDAARQAWFAVHQLLGALSRHCGVALYGDPGEEP